MDESPPHTDDPALADIDLYCLGCGYNLRGHSGDPRRCPECGENNPVGELLLPAELIRAQFEKMESAPVVCVVATLLGFPVTLAIIWTTLRIGRLGALNVCTGVILLVCGVLWFWGASRFQKSCLDNPGWPEVLFKFHALAVGLCLLILLATPFGAILLVEPIGSLLGVSTNGFRLSGWLWLMPVAIAGVYFGYQRFYPSVRASMDELQREVAVTIARDVRRREIRAEQ